jgi:hypothetical protein
MFTIAINEHQDQMRRVKSKRRPLENINRTAWSTTVRYSEVIYTTPKVAKPCSPTGAIVIFIFRDHTETDPTFFFLLTPCGSADQGESHTNNVKLSTIFELGNTQNICEIPGFRREV